MSDKKECEHEFESLYVGLEWCNYLDWCKHCHRLRPEIDGYEQGRKDEKLETGKKIFYANNRKIADAIHKEAYNQGRKDGMHYMGSYSSSCDCPHCQMCRRVAKKACLEERQDKLKIVPKEFDLWFNDNCIPPQKQPLEQARLYFKIRLVKLFGEDEK